MNPSYFCLVRLLLLLEEKPLFSDCETLRQVVVKVGEVGGASLGQPGQGRCSNNITNCRGERVGRVLRDCESPDIESK